jgi:hypothetical protein
MAVSVFDFRDELKKYPVIDVIIKLAKDVETDDTGEVLQRLQWDKGEDKYGNILGRYSYATQILSGGKKIAGEPYNLKETGSFWQETYLKAIITSEDIYFEISSNDYKTPELISKIGDRIFGLEDENMNKFKESVKNLLITILNDIVK